MSLINKDIREIFAALNGAKPSKGKLAEITLACLWASSRLGNAFSPVGPMVMVILFQEVFGEVSEFRPDLGALARSHAD